VNIRLEQGKDRSDVAAVHRAAFGDRGVIVARLVDDLRGLVAKGEGVSLVAEGVEGVVGHAMFTSSLLDAPRRLISVQVLSPVGVVPGQQRLGVGSAIITRGLEILVERCVPVVFVEGPPQYYARFGFEPGADHGFRKPSLRIPDTAFQALRLPSHEPWMSGTLVYSETFWRHDAVGLREA
jgi:putative acetyltransferase